MTQGVNRRSLLGAACALLAGSATSPAAADTYPSKPIRFLVPFAPGGGTDLVARVVAEELSKALKVSVIVENRPVAAGILVDDTVARAEPDGYTLSVITPQFTLNPNLYLNLPFDPVKDLAPVVLMTRHQYIIAASNNYAPSTIAEVIADAKARPGVLNYATGGSNGGGTHLAGELFKIKAGIQMTHVPYKGSAPAYTDVMRGEVPLILTNIITTMPLVNGGKLKAIAVAGPKRAHIAPNVPTVAESGLPDYGITSWFGLLAPGRTPKPVIDRLNGEIVRIVNTPAVAERLLAQGVEPAGTTPEEFGEILRRETAQWAEVLKAAGISAAAFKR